MVALCQAPEHRFIPILYLADISCRGVCFFVLGLAILSLVRDAKIFIFLPSSYLQISNFLLSGNQKQPRESANEIFQRALGSLNRKDFTVTYIADN